MSKITFEKQAAQGDVLITRVENIPDDAVLDTTDLDDYVVAHSETGHNHVMASKNVDFFKVAADRQEAFSDPFVLFIIVRAETDLRHLRNFDTHKTITVPPGNYRIDRQREYTPEGFRRAAD